MTDFTVTVNEFLPLREVVFQTLRQAILKGELKPGERLMEMALSEKLGVSRTPIREAMRKLELEGLVVMVPRKGAQVASITEKDMNDVLELRITLESMAIEKACLRMTESEMDELWQASAQFEQAVSEDDLVRIAEADEAFHELIYRGAGNDRLLQVLNNLKEQMYRYRLEYIKDELNHGRLLEEHTRLAEAIRNRNIDSARQISFEHLENQRKAIIRSLQESQKND